MSRLLSTWKWMAVASLAGFTPEYSPEQVHDRGLDTALVEIYDPETNLVTWMTLPTAKRLQPDEKWDWFTESTADSVSETQFLTAS